MTRWQCVHETTNWPAMVPGALACGAYQ
jgi:hypothetical protein